MGGCVTRHKDKEFDDIESSNPYVKQQQQSPVKTGEPLTPQTPRLGVQTPRPLRPLPGVSSRTATPTKGSDLLLHRISNGNSSRTSSPHHVIHSPEPRRTSLPQRAPCCYLEDSDSPCRRSGSGTPIIHAVQNNNNNVCTQPVTKQSVLTAMFDYCARTDVEIGFIVGDSLVLLDSSDSDWWYAEHRTTKSRGYIPVALVALENSLESRSWFSGSLPRKEAERQLLMPKNPRGTFLVRESESHKESYSLSVLDYDVKKDRDTVKHYRIRMLDSGAGCFITSREKFTSMQSLINYYGERDTGLCCQLTVPCPRPTPTITDLSYQTRDQWEIPRELLILEEQLGSGQFGEVWQGRFNGKLEVAVKMLKAGSMSRADFLKEAKIMTKLKHPKLVKLFAVCTQEDPVYIVTELMSNGALLNYLRDRRLEFELLVDIMGQIASGMAYLEQEKFIHRDLAARNILVGSNNVVKVADFGLSRTITETDNGEYTAKQGAKFPIKWTSPEAALLGKFSVKSDVWSFGIVLFEIITHGQIPYPGFNNTETLQAIERGYRMPRPSECPQSLYEKMLECWDDQPELRPTFLHLRYFFDDFIPASEPNYRSTKPINDCSHLKQSPIHQVQVV